MNLFTVLEISGSALGAERQRAEVAASNLANAETTRTTRGGAYRRQEVVFGSSRVHGSNFREMFASLTDLRVRGVRVDRVMTDPAEPIRRYQPSHPDADAQGYVEYPNVNPIAEMVDLVGAARSYQLNVSAIQSTKAMIQQTLELLQ